MPDGVVFENTFVPFDTIDTLEGFFTTVGIHNYTGCLDSGRLCWSMSDTAQVVYAESMDIDLEPDLGSYFIFHVPRFTTTGPHHGIMHFWTYGGSADTLEWDFWVGPPLGMQDAAAGMTAERKLPVTVFRSLPRGTAAFDAMGRRVLHPKPGIYFLRTEATAAPRKVLLVE